MDNEDAMKEFVVNLLQKSVTASYAYHNYKHTLYVLEKAVELAIKEACTSNEMGLIKAAALWHDTGYIVSRIEHENESCILATHHLPAYGFTEEQINQVNGMIRATKIPQDVHNRLEAIVADADLAYLGTAQASQQADKLYQEMQAFDSTLTKEIWNRIQIEFLEQHHFFTRFCKERNEPVKQLYIAQLRQEFQ